MCGRKLSAYGMDGWIDSESDMNAECLVNILGADNYKFYGTICLWFVNCGVGNQYFIISYN